MKVFNIFTLLALLFYHAFSVADEFQVVTSANINGGKITLLRLFDKSDTRTNPDKSIFYRTVYKVLVQDGKRSTEDILETELYTAEGFPMSPCLLIDSKSKVVTIFSNGKDADESEYSMIGYAYRLDSSKQWKKEVAFNSGNHGWFSYFGGSSNGNPELWHFSYDGYRLLKSERNNSENWNTEDFGWIDPQEVDRDYKEKSKILFSSSFGSQKPDQLNPTQNQTVSRQADCEKVKQTQTVFTEVNKQANKMIRSGNMGEKLYGGILKLMYGAIPSGVEQGNPDCYPR